VDIILLVLHVILSLGIITLVLLQKGAGASAGAAFGGGGAGSVFGATGSANFLSKTTAIFAICFFINSLVLAYLAAHREVQTDSVLDALTTQPAAVEEVIEVPAAAEVPAVEEDVPAPEGMEAIEADMPVDADSADDAAVDEVPPADDVPAPVGE
jgi:preprotein translocase subunit SecG